MKPDWDEIKAWFLSYELAPSDDKDHIIKIDKQTYNRMLVNAAQLYGEKFATFVRFSIGAAMVDTTGGQYYLAAETWGDIEEEYNQEYNEE